MGWVTADAPIGDEVGTCIQCGLCLPSCPTFRLTGLETASPRGRLTAMLAVADGMAVDQHFSGIMDSCLQCRACEVVCPAFVPFGKTMEAARAEVAAQQPSLGRRLRRLVVGRGLRNRRALRWATFGARMIQRLRVHVLVPRRLRSGLRGLRVLRSQAPSILGTSVAARGAQRGVVAVLAGCVMDQWFGDVHKATVEVLTRAGYEVVVPQSQTCCGALAAHDGWADDARSMARVNVAAFSGYDLVVTDSAGCGAHLKEYEHWTPNGAELGSKVRDITEVVAEAIGAGILPTMHEDQGPVAVQDPCHLRHAQRVLDQPRHILAAAGYQPVEIDPDGHCCGAAGLYSVLQPEMSAELGAAKAAQVLASRAPVVASANPGCEIQLRSFLEGDVRVAHPVELYWEALRVMVEA